MSAREAEKEWVASVTGSEPDLEDGLDESAGAVPEADGALESDDLSAITYTDSDDIPSTDDLDIGDARL
jgi:hypothetical protein